MHDFGVETGKSLFDDLSDPVPPGRIAEVELEGMVFFLHLLDRAAFEQFGPFKRRVFMDAVLEGIAETSPPIGLQKSTFRDVWNARQDEYAAFQKLYPEDGKSWKGTLCWEFAKRMGLEYGNANPVRITLIASRGLSMIEVLRKALSTFEA